ncbi:hypothetical protein ElyMa_002763300 [Elysia marginata]|uniref:Uncharacterized protein n=1 Tax=Elysia marginata TaxID=1093978 RepID=A0AAV4HJ54_9GAST|nr:hypothetical protein ElyMa_002763300 [Elysia marginata]
MFEQSSRAHILQPEHCTQFSPLLLPSKSAQTRQMVSSSTVDDEKGISISGLKWNYGSAGERFGVGGCVADEEAVDAGGRVADEEAVGAGGRVANEEAVGAGGRVADKEAVGAAGRVADKEAVGAGERVADIDNEAVCVECVDMALVGIGRSVTSAAA